MTTTPKIGLPEISTSQAQKEVTHNEALRILDQMAFWGFIKDKDLATPPGAPADGDAYIVASSPTGAWTGHATDIAFYSGTAWAFVEPAGCAYVIDEGVIYRWTGSAWAIWSPGVSAGVPMNLALSISVAANALTVAWKNWAGSDPSAASPAVIPFRSATAGSGDQDLVSVAAAASITAPSGAELGHESAFPARLYHYAINNAGAAEPAISGKFFGHSGIVSTTTIGTGADSATVMYSTTGRSNVPFICLGYSEDTQATKGTWATAPSLVVNAPFKRPLSAVSARRDGSTAQTGIVTATHTKIALTNEDFDLHGEFDSATNYRFRPMEPEIVQASGSIMWESILVDQAQSAVSFHKTGVIYKHGTFPAFASTSSAQGRTVSVSIPCLPTEYIELYVWHNTGSNEDISGASDATWLTILQQDVIYP